MAARLLLSTLAARRLVLSSTPALAAVSPLACAARRLLHASAAQHKVVAFNLADIGEGITEAALLQWCETVGSGRWSVGAARERRTGSGD